MWRSRYNGHFHDFRSHRALLACSRMMASRKRKLSTDSNNHIPTGLSSIQDPAKRFKLDSGRTSGSSAIRDEEKGVKGNNVQQDYYTIKSIIKEKRGRYLIDWEDDPSTGEKFKPSWVSVHQDAATRYLYRIQQRFTLVFFT